MEEAINEDYPGADAISGKTMPSESYVDIHCHCLAGLDDGPSTGAEALALCSELVADGIKNVIATPHQLGRFNDCNDAGDIRAAVTNLNEELIARDIRLRVMPGADIRIDERICRLLEADRILTLADGGKFILLELPGEILIDIEPLLSELSDMGIQAVISHPERHRVLAKQPKILVNWLGYSSHLQITAGSLLGEFGHEAEKAAWYLLNAGWVCLVATDSHDVAVRRPRMRAAFRRISMKLGEATARLVCIDNPTRILEGHNLCDVRSLGTEKVER